MKFKCSCDMRGMLSFHILWLLSKKPMHGNEIAEEIGKKRGDKPKSGTIYPALKDLKLKGLIKGERKEKFIVYSLTVEGRKDIKYAMNYFLRAFGDIFEDCKKTR
jgi:PadR family transcriptional regulator, regulatory protein PadR